jgi:uncharacterized protein (TIGR00304 family)
MDAEALVHIGFLIIVIGVVIILLGALFLASGGSASGETEVGGVIIIGPIPIIFGSSSKAALIAAVLGLVIMVISLIIFLSYKGAP